jgi:hypothetical protein
MNSPFHVFFRKAAPALPANRQFLPFEKYVQFDVLALALMLPRVLTMLQHVNLHVSGFTHLTKTAFKANGETVSGNSREIG